MQIKKIIDKSLLAILSLSAMFLVYSCTEEYWPELNSDYEYLLTVDGKITNDPGPYTIKLLKSASIDTNSFNPISGARITIIDSDGSNELLSETESGVYQTNPYGIRGIVGHEYKISIEVNGKHYESSFEELLEPVGVESMTAEWTRRSGATSDEDEYGFQFYLTTEMANDPINYYFWELSETFRYQALYKTWFIYNGTDDFIVSDDIYSIPSDEIMLLPVRDVDTVKNCWLTNLIDQRFTYATKNISTPKINNFPINFSPNSVKFEFKYALQAKQYRVSENAYIFMSSLEEQNNVENTLYTSQPYQILGNVYNVDDMDEPVLGYFITAGVSTSQPVMVNSPKDYKIPIKWGMCVDPPPFQSNLQLIETLQSMPSSTWPIFVAVNPYGELPTPMIIDPECVDCRAKMKGGVNQKPYYWDDNSLLIYDGGN